MATNKQKKNGMKQRWTKQRRSEKEREPNDFCLVYFFRFQYTRITGFVLMFFRFAVSYMQTLCLRLMCILLLLLSSMRHVFSLFIPLFAMGVLVSIYELVWICVCEK